MRILYVLNFANGKKYVGQTRREMKTRLLSHKWQAECGDSQLAVHNAWRKHGEPSVEIISETFDSDEDLNQAEIDLIKELNTLSPNGYNLSYGGETAPSKNPEVAKKISEKARGRNNQDVDKLSKISEERWQDPEYREKVSAGLKASWTPEKREARSKKMKELWAKKKADGWVMPESQKEKMRGKVFSEETRKKMSESAKKRGAPQIGEEGRRKLSEATKAMWADPEKKAERLKQIEQGWIEKHLKEA